MIVDTETHVFYFARSSRDNPEHETIRKHYTWHEHDGDLLVAEMDHAGVDQALLISYDADDTRVAAESVGFGMEDFAGGRKHALRQIRKHPDRLLWISVVKGPPLTADPVARVRADLAEGAVGFKMFPPFLGADLRAEPWSSVLRTLQDAGSRLLLSYEYLLPGETRSVSDYLGELDAALDAVPELPVALLHAGCIDPLALEADRVVTLMERHPNVVLSNAMPGAVWDDGCEYPFANLLARVARLHERVGADRLMWATDWPWFEHEMTYKQSIDCFRLHAPFFTAAELAEFLGGTAARFLAPRS
ncbi:MAG TPA: amidohydrolase family protein [Baekduia sp.]|nr:amidohydrolase family protein [Baekduia sp.]